MYNFYPSSKLKTVRKVVVVDQHNISLTTVENNYNITMLNRNKKIFA